MIVIEPYNPDWAKTFADLKTIYRKQLADLILDIEHVGSTSVVGLAAKPVIDIDILVDSRAKIAPVIERLAPLSYLHVGNLGITDREAFKRVSELTPANGSLRRWPMHNLYVCPADSISLKNHLLLRNFLRNNPEKAKEYGELKKQLAAKYENDIERYVEGKTNFITAILKEVGFSNADLQNIALQNKADDTRTTII